MNNGEIDSRQASAKIYKIYQRIVMKEISERDEECLGGGRGRGMEVELTDRFDVKA